MWQAFGILILSHDHLSLLLIHCLNISTHHFCFEDQEFQKAKAELVQQMQETTHAQKMMDSLELNSKYFNVGVYDDSGKPADTGDQKPSWYGTKDLNHSKDINITGLPDPGNYTSNYNRDKYGRRVPVHQYSGIGDPMKTGMDFSEKSPAPRRSMTTYERHRDPDWLPRDAYMKQSKADQSELAIQLPPNIQHTFGSRICRSVLNDKDKVDSSMDDQKRLEASFYRIRDGKRSAFKLPSDNIDPVYEGLSHAVRQNMFPGYTYNHKKSLTKSVYSQDVHNRRLKDPDKWRYQRDELSKYFCSRKLYLVNC